jgi:glycerol-3-phosphate acyltransferase PlsY
MQSLIYLVIGYFCGSVPFGLLLTRMAGLGDIRAVGSGNIGATNVLRTGNKGIAALTLLMDTLKGFIPVFAASHYAGTEASIAAAVGALAGHMMPVWLGFRGGKGVATLIGVAFGFDWRLGAIFLAAWLALALLFRISSLSALVASALLPLAAFYLGAVDYVVPLGAFAVVVWYRHKDNIARLLKGEESRISLGGAK